MYGDWGDEVKVRAPKIRTIDLLKSTKGSEKMPKYY